MNRITPRQSDIQAKTLAADVLMHGMWRQWMMSFMGLICLCYCLIFSG